MSSNWVESIYRLREQNQTYALVTVISVQGSAPRESGCKFVVTPTEIFDTIGGGHLEYKCIEMARELMQDKRALQHIEHFPLAARLGQCCGGRVSVLFEVFPAAAMNLVLFGAGHVGRALTTILQELPCRVTWVDSREAEFPSQQAANIDYLVSDHPADEAVDMPPNSHYLVMTHDHKLDMAICEAVLTRGDFAYLGVIGSESKAGRFRLRLKRQGHDAELVDKMHCPVGLAAVPGKRPMEVAVSIAGELIALMNRSGQSEIETSHCTRKRSKLAGVELREMTSLLKLQV